MRYVSANDSVQAQAFLPMALGAYEMAEPLDHDGLFHLSLLNRVAGNLDSALANAQEVLAADPNHVLALAAAAEASVELGDREAASGYYGRLLEVIDAEIARGLPEYLAHQTIMESVRSDAEAFLGG
jgi:tetratricopeptide (TPR) repeat protein